MHFLNPSGAWALLAVLPIIALYVLKSRATRTRVPSLLLWQRVHAQTEVSRPFEKLKSKLLLWVQLLLAVLMALVLMRPATMDGANGEKAFVFDLSASMQTANQNGTRLDVAKQRALALLETLEDGDAVTVLGAGSEVIQLAARSTDRIETRRVIEGLRAQNGAADMDGALSLALAMKRDLPELEVLVFSDTYTPQSKAVTLEAVGHSTENHGITSLTISQNENETMAYARVMNYGQAADATLECYADGALCDLRTVTLPAGEAASVRFSLPAGAAEARVCFAKPDALPADDERYAHAQTRAEETALLVSDGNVFLERALSLRDGFTLYKTTDATVDEQAAYDLYVYDGKLPQTLPPSGAIWVIDPSVDVAGIVPMTESGDTSALRVAAGQTAEQITENLILSDIAMRSYKPLTGGQPVLYCGDQAVLSLAEAEGRRVAVLGFDLHDSNLPLKADFPVLVQNLLSYLMPDVQTVVENAVCGDTLTLPIHSRATDAWVVTPLGKRAELTNGTLADTDEIGLYTLVERFESGEERQARFAVHMPETEADTRIVSASETGASGGAITTAASAREWMTLLIALWLVLLLVEWGVSRRGVSV